MVIINHNRNKFNTLLSGSLIQNVRTERITKLVDGEQLWSHFGEIEKSLSSADELVHGVNMRGHTISQTNR
jgi:hypothetical protein